MHGTIVVNMARPGCEICVKANITRLPFSTSASSQADRPLFRIHTNIYGPLPVGYGGYQYFSPFIDDFGRYAGVGFLKAKSEAHSCAETFLNASESFHQTSTATIRVDNAPEFVHGQFKAMCERWGITYKKIVPDASPQNGVAEWVNRTFASMARSLLLDANILTYFWLLAIQAAVHIKNHVPHTALPPNITPYEMWFGRKPDISHL